jgi:phosphatidylglycerophosphate synthase
VSTSAVTLMLADDERRRARAYPLSRWYLRPAAGRLAALLARCNVSPHWLTLGNLLLALAAAGLMSWRPSAAPLAALLVLGAWLCDRTDGQLARRRHVESRLGAWLDANVDELTDLGLHLAMALAATTATGSVWPWRLFVAFVIGKYLFIYGLAEERGLERRDEARDDVEAPRSILRHVYHLPGNADVRVHLLVAALLTGWLTAELACVAIYYNLRWMARYALVARRWGGVE